MYQHTKFDISMINFPEIQSLPEFGVLTQDLLLNMGILYTAVGLSHFSIV